MRSLNTSGLTAAAVLTVALIGGAVGGVVALSSGEPAAPQAPVVELRDANAEVSPSPAASPSAAPAGQTMEGSPAEPVEQAPQEVTVSRPTEIEPAVDETASDAADRAEEAAERSEDEADRSEDAADRAEQAPTTETGSEPSSPSGGLGTEPAPPAEPVEQVEEPECEEGEKVGLGYRGLGVNDTGYRQGEKTCIDGKWVVTVEPRDSDQVRAYEQCKEAGGGSDADCRDAAIDGRVNADGSIASSEPGSGRPPPSGE